MSRKHELRVYSGRTAVLLLAVFLFLGGLLMVPMSPAAADETPLDATLLSGDILDQVTVSFHPAGNQSSLSVKGNGGGAGQNVVHLYNTGDAFRFWLTRADDDSYYIDFFGGADDYSPSNKRLDLSDNGGYGQSGNVVHVVWRNKEAQNKRWRFYQNADGTYYIQNKKSGLYWDIKTEDEDKLCQRELSKATKWEMEIVHADGKRSIKDLKQYDSYSFLLNGKSVTGANWMSFLPDDMVLSDVTIPGTHDSGTAQMTLMWNATAQCQQLSILDQLYSGVRYFDLRLGMGLAIVHGILDLNCQYKGRDLYLETVMDWFIQFLKENPGETVIIQPQVDAKWDFLLYEVAYEYFQDLIDDHPGLFYVGNSVPKLSECRGKIVMLSRLSGYDNDDYTDTSIGKQWALDVKAWKAWSENADDPLELTASGNNYEVWTEDFHKKIDDDKWTLVTNAVFNPTTGAVARRNAAKINGKDCWVISYTSCVNNGNPKKYPQWEARYINPKLVEKLQSEEMKNGQFLGVVCSDFTDQQLAYLVYKQNFIANIKTITIRGMTQDGAEPIKPMVMQVSKDLPLAVTLGSEETQKEIDKHFSADNRFRPYGYWSGTRDSSIEQLRGLPFSRISNAAEYESQNGFLNKYHGYDAPDEVYVALDRITNVMDTGAPYFILELLAPKCGTEVTAEDENWATQTPKPQLMITDKSGYHVDFYLENWLEKVYWLNRSENKPFTGKITGGTEYNVHLELETEWGYCFETTHRFRLRVVRYGEKDLFPVGTIYRGRHLITPNVYVIAVHDLQYMEAKPATCTEAGWREHWLCSGCGKRFWDSEAKQEAAINDVITDASGHAWGSWIVTKEATETEEGEEKRVCSRDSSHVETRIIPMTGHVHQVTQVPAKAATCTEDGCHEHYVCSGGDHPCGRYFSDSEGKHEIDSTAVIIPALGHLWATPEYTWASDYESLTASRVCLRDSTHMETETDTYITKNIQNPTCTGVGYLTVSGAFQNPAFSPQQKVIEIDALGHDYEETYRVPATCQVAGRISLKCKNNQNHVDYKELPIIPHNTSERITTDLAPTCESEGTRTTEMVCAMCHQVIETKTETLAALGHNWEEPTYTWSADNTKVTAEHICKRDSSHVESETVNAYYANIPATCESEGVQEWYSDEFKNEDFTIQEKDKEILPALGHDWGEWVTTKEATQTENGLETRTCRHDASHVQIRVIPAGNHGHHLSHIAAKAATCEEAGNIEYWTCDQETDACGKYFSDEAGQNEISEADTLLLALGHLWGDWETLTAASCTYKGSEIQICSRNPNHWQRRETDIDPNAHIWGKWIITERATATSPGSKTRVCSLNEEHHGESVPIPVPPLPAARERLVYNQSSQELITADSVPAGMEYALGTNTETAPTEGWNTSLPKGTDAGNYYVWYRTSEDDAEYNITGVVTAVIQKAMLTDVYLENTVLRYTGEPLTAVISQVKAGDLIVPPDAYTVTGLTGTYVGVYTVTVTPKDDSNYQLIVNTTFSIISATGKYFNLFIASEVLDNIRYTGQPVQPPVSVIDIDTGKELSPWLYTITCDQDPNVGFGSVTVTGWGDYEGCIKTHHFRIRPALLTVTAKDKTITYGDEPASDGVTYTGFVNNESESVLTGTLSFDYTYSQYDNAGNYVITPKGLNASNYEITYAPGTLKVEPKVIGLIWSNTALVYNGSEQTPTAAATGLVNNDSVGITVTGGQTNAGTYTATAASLTGAKKNNYMLPADRTASFTIAKAANPAAVSGTAAVTVGGNTVDLSNNVILNGADGTVSYALSEVGENLGCSINGSVLTSGTATGTVTVLVTVAEGTNHWASETKTITVTVTEKQTQNLSFAEDPVNKTYGDNSFINRLSGVRTYATYAVTSGSEVAEIAPDGTVTIKAAGTAVITATAVGTNAIEGAAASYTLNVKKAASGVIPPEAKPGLVDIGAPQELVTAGSAVGGELLYAVTRDNQPPYENEYLPAIPKGDDAGTYFVWYRVKGDGNHFDTPPAFLPVTISDDLVYQAVSGEGQNHVRGSGLDAVFTLKGIPRDNAYEAMAEAQVNGTTLLGSSYTRARGSLILTLKAYYLDTLPAGPQTLTVLFENNQEVNIPFTVSEASEVTPEPDSGVPKTGDSSAPFLWLATIVLGLLGPGIGGLISAKKRQSTKSGRK